jgi:hypothetical protein
MDMKLGELANAHYEVSFARVDFKPNNPVNSNPILKPNNTRQNLNPKFLRNKWRVSVGLHNTHKQVSGSLCASGFFTVRGYGYEAWRAGECTL